MKFVVVPLELLYKRAAIGRFDRKIFTSAEPEVGGGGLQCRNL